MLENISLACIAMNILNQIIKLNDQKKKVIKQPIKHSDSSSVISDFTLLGASPYSLGVDSRVLSHQKLLLQH